MHVTNSLITHQKIIIPLSAMQWNLQLNWKELSDRRWKVTGTIVTSKRFVSWLVKVWKDWKTLTKCLTCREILRGAKLHFSLCLLIKYDNFAETICGYCFFQFSSLFSFLFWLCSVLWNGLFCQSSSLKTGCWWNLLFWQFLVEVLLYQHCPWSCCTLFWINIYNATRNWISMVEVIYSIT